MIARKVLLTAFLFLVAVVACGAKPTVPAPRVYEGAIPKSAVPITTPPPEFAVYYQQVKECAGKARIPYRAIRWYFVITANDHGFRWVDPWGEVWWVAGLAYSQKNAIVMGDRWLFNPDYLRHELLHLVASPTSHDPEVFQRKCKHVVTCHSTCLSDTL